METAFVFDPDTGYGRVDDIRSQNKMPDGVHFLASVSGPWNIMAIVDLDDLAQLPGRVGAVQGPNGSGDPDTATVVGFAKVKKSVYSDHMAFIRIETRVADPSQLLGYIVDAIGSDEADVVAGDFDILACAAGEDQSDLASKIFALRAIEEVRRTVSLRVIDYVSEAPGAPVGHHLPSDS
jgi:hypothetical protein